MPTAQTWTRSLHTWAAARDYINKQIRLILSRKWGLPLIRLIGTDLPTLIRFEFKLWHAKWQNLLTKTIWIMLRTPLVTCHRWHNANRRRQIWTTIASGHVNIKRQDLQRFAQMGDARTYVYPYASCAPCHFIPKVFCARDHSVTCVFSGHHVTYEFVTTQHTAVELEGSLILASNQNSRRIC